MRLPISSRLKKSLIEGIEYAVGTQTLIVTTEVGVGLQSGTNVVRSRPTPYDSGPVCSAIRSERENLTELGTRSSKAKQAHDEAPADL